jgi:hypothetical protein
MKCPVCINIFSPRLFLAALSSIVPPMRNVLSGNSLTPICYRAYKRQIMAFPQYKDIEIPLLQVLIAAGGRATPKEATKRVTTFFPDLTPDDLLLPQPSGKDLKWRNMVAWVRNTLCDREAIDRTQRGVWVITAQGRQLVERAARAVPAERPPVTPPPAVVKPREVVPIGKALYHRLRTTAHSGTDATAFEEALAEAFSLLGFEARKIGGRGDTDILITAPLGKHQYKAIVDAKSSRTGKVADTALHFSSFHDHREKNQADFVMVVAPGFMRGNALTHAEREHVVLMDVASFITILEMHERAPFSLYILREMFTRPGLYGAIPDPLREAHEYTERLAALLPLIVQKIEQWYSLRHVDAVNADSLFIAFIEHFGQARYPKEMIEAALAYLASPFIGALRKNDVGYYLTMPLRTVQERLFRLGAAFQQVSAGGRTRYEAQADEVQS